MTSEEWDAYRAGKAAYYRRERKPDPPDPADSRAWQYYLGWLAAEAGERP
jgi:hypothetical protein